MSHPQRQEAAHLGFSSDGRLLSVLYPRVQYYRVYRRTPGTETWDTVSEGSAKALAWHHRDPMFAILEIPAISAPSGQSFDSKSRKSRKQQREEAERLRVARQMAKAAAESSATVAIHREKFPGEAVTKVVDLDTGKEEVVGLRGGGLLGVVLQPDRTNSSGRFQMFGWEDGAKLGPEVPAAHWVEWDSDGEFAALGYSDSVVICHAEKKLSVVGMLPIRDSVQAMWHVRQLFVTCPGHVYCVFVLPDHSQREATLLQQYQGTGGGEGGETDATQPQRESFATLFAESSLVEQSVRFGGTPLWSDRAPL